MRAYIKLLFAGLAALSGPAGMAQEPDAALPGGIVVTGVTNAEIQQAALAVTAPGNLLREALPRFQQPVCPGVIGAPLEFAAQTVERIREAARRLDIRVAKDGCKANLLVVFMPSGQAAMQNLSNGGPWLFGDIPPAALRDLKFNSELKKLAADPGPVHVWVNIQTRSRDGALMTGRGDFVEPSLMKAPGASSHLTMASRRDIISSMIVIDTPAAAGMSAEQIGDYAAMRGLARTRPPAQPGPVDTILSLFGQEADPPLEMTDFDLAYLRAAYGSQPNIAAMHNVAGVGHELDKGQDEERAAE